MEYPYESPVVVNDGVSGVHVLSKDVGKFRYLYVGAYDGDLALRDHDVLDPQFAEFRYCF